MKERGHGLLGVLTILAVLLVACGQAADTPTEAPPAPTRAYTASSFVDPSLRISWQWQLAEEPVDLALDVDMYDIDLFENDASVVSELHARQRPREQRGLSELPASIVAWSLPGCLHSQ